MISEDIPILMDTLKEKNKMHIQCIIECACGCGQTLEKYDKYGIKQTDIASLFNINQS